MKYSNFIKKSIASILAFTIIPTAFSMSVFAATKKTNLTSVTVMSSSQVKLKWKKISSVKGYEIYQKKSSGKYKKIKTITSKNTSSFTVKKLLPATKYSYKIRTYKTVKSQKQYSPFSASKTVTTKPSVPVLLSAVAKDNFVNVKWSEISGVKGYVIYKITDKTKTKVGGVSAGKTELSFSGNQGDVITARAYIKSGSKNVYSDYAKEITVVAMKEEAPQEPVTPPEENIFVTKDILDENINSLKNIIESGYVTQEKLQEHINSLSVIVENNYVTKEDFLQHTESLKAILEGYVTQEKFNAYSDSLTEILNANYVTDEKLNLKINELKEFLKTTYVTDEQVEKYLQDLKAIFENSYVTPKMMEEYFANIKDSLMNGVVTEEVLNFSIADVKSEIAEYYATKENLEQKLTEIKTEISEGYATKEKVNEYFDELKTLITEGYVSHEAIAEYLDDILAVFDEYVSKEELSETIDKNLADIKAELQKITASIESPLKGKRIAVLGDSISYRPWYNGSCYTELIENKTGCTFIDYALAGSRIGERAADTKDSFVERYPAMDDTADAVIVVGGTNDFNTTKLGDFNSTDNTTFYGAMNELLTNLVKKYPGKPIIFFAPIKAAYTNYTAPLTEYEVKQLTANDKVTKDNIASVMSLKCRQYGVKCVDLASEAGINGYDPDRVYFKDDLHPSALGMQKIASVVYSELEKQFVFAN